MNTMDDQEMHPENINSEETSTEENPYAYLDRQFSSENFKIEVKNLPKFYGINEFRKLLNQKLKLNSNKIKTVKRNSPYAFVCFRNNEDRDNALKALSNYKWKGKLLEVIKAKPAPDPLVKKRKEEAEDSGVNKKSKTDVASKDKLKSSTTPYWNVEYNEQLRLKQEDIKTVLKRLGSDLVHHNPELRKWIDKQRSAYNGLPCNLRDIRFVKEIDGYRNKCEFSVGIDEETNLPTVGFRIGSYVNGTTGVAPVEDLLHIPDSMKIAVKVFQDYVRASNLKVFSPEFQTGHFRQLMARSASGQLMLVVGIHPQNLNDDEVTGFKKSLVDFFSVGDGKKANVTSLYYQKLVKKNHNNDFIPAEHLWGDTHIYETILGLKFRISPEAFFQINTKGAEALYNTAIELAAPTGNSTILDVCCGTGTIGLCFAKQCTQVLGLEVVPQAIVDAKENATINDIVNAEFFTGKAEEILGSVCFKATNNEVVAIVDPPRAGLHQKAILQIRKISKISKVIYIACNPALALKNFVDLGRPESKTVHGEPFVPVKAVPVDMFPYTKHCELVVCFERWDKVSKEQKVEETNEEQGAGEEAVVKDS
ncbi:tRNA (uracil-5-)-methyltransferase homolog A [Anoplophora glabripennis]|uniref:tRNA (uracil-5-)-methyltransferase homolog A n=1 Tax=Anoplophora glabripennis TaxID=217634 RepID=UPI000874F161|nr:tRNA (uracil-5-)-methyltransferase homolog A [Anoplophora glabripennis]